MNDPKIKVDEYSKLFPVEIQDTIYYLNGDIEFIYNCKKKEYQYILSLIDNFDYKYNTNIRIFKAKIREKSMLTRFFYGNIYTYDNINNFCRLNNIDLYIDGNELPVKNYAREKLDFYNSKNQVKKISWNQLQHYTETFQSNYNKVLKARKEKRTISKKQAIQIILNMQNAKGSPLDIHDFLPKQKNGVGIRKIREYWGTLENMQSELGLKVTKYQYKLQNDEVIEDLHKICNLIKENKGINFVNADDFKKYGVYPDPRRYQEACKILKNMSLRDYITSLGFVYQKPGQGNVTIFEDGEKTLSSYEYTFSSFLRKSGLVYNKDYFRDVKYSLIDTEYNGDMNCDYVVCYNEKYIFVEIAGFLNNSYKRFYVDDKPIKVKHKEKYRLDLKKKEQLFKKNNIEYFILFPGDLTRDFFVEILNNPSQLLRDKINCHFVNAEYVKYQKKWDEV